MLAALIVLLRSLGLIWSALARVVGTSTERTRNAVARSESSCYLIFGAFSATRDEPQSMVSRLG